MNTQDLNLWHDTPGAFAIVWACVLLLIDLFIPKDRKDITALAGDSVWSCRWCCAMPEFRYATTAFNGMFICRPVQRR